MPDGLYERDILDWSEHQADLLRRLAAGERLNEAVDWANVIEEIESVGRSQLYAVTSLLRQALVHLLKQRAWPSSKAAGHWRAEAVGFLADADQTFSPSMRQRIELADIYLRALRQVRADADDAGEAAPLPDACPFTLDEMLAGDVPALAARLEADMSAAAGG